MANIRDVDEYKQKILELILSDEIAVNLISGEKSHALPAKDLIYKAVFPYDWLNTTSLTARAYVSVEANVSGVSTTAVKNCEIHILVMCHEDAMSLINSDLYHLSYTGGTLRDKLSDRIDYLLNGNINFGFGKLELISAPVFDPGGRYYGRELVYMVQDFNKPYEKLRPT